MVFKKVALAFGIAIILPMMLYQGASTIAPKPKRGDYDISAMTDYLMEKNIEKRDKLRAEAKKRDNERNLILKRHDTAVFFVSVPAGILVIILGALISVKALGAGLIFGGILSVCTGYMNNWPNLSASLRFVSLLVAFIALIFVGYKKIESRSEKANPG